MATIPIEVIVQDAEAPIVPSEDGTNTNTNTEATVAVPDTGSGTGNIFTGSASAIVLPAILLVLAIGSIVAILIHKYHKQKKDKISKKEKLAMAATSTIAVLAATVLIGNLVIPATKAATSDAVDGITPAEDKVSIVVTRDGGSVEESIESTATITSTSDFGYKVLLSMTEGVETSNLYLDGNEDGEYYIAATESTELGNNTWGYALAENGEYSAVPLDNKVATITKEIAKVESKELNVYYGANVDKDLPAGTYSGEIEYALKPAIEYMQDFATISAEEKASVLALMAQDQQYQLADNRDQTMYYIAKLADGNVWMTQNLDLDLSTTKELTPSDTDIAENWTPSSTTINFTGATVNGWVNSDTAPCSANPGDIYYYTSGTTENDIQYNSLTECEAAGHTDCQHYHAGNYYNWSAAVASNDTVESIARYTNMEDSICPAGWELPTGRQSDDSALEGNKLGSLIYSYGIVGPLQYCGGTCYNANYLEDGFNNIRIAPLWLARSGYVSGGSLGNVANYGYYWSSTADDSNYAYYLSFYSDGVNPAGNNGMGIGYSVRCVAQ